MNGRFPAPAVPGDDNAPINDRLAGALAVSLLLHAVVVLLPYLGEHGASAPVPHPASPPPFAASFAVLPDSTATTPAEPRRDRSPPPPPAAAEPGRGLGALPLPAPDYYTTDQLHKRPQPLALEELDTPETRAVVASGKLVLKLWIDEQGRVADAAVEKSDLPDIFAAAAVAGFKNSRFLPGERNGLRVGTVMRIEVSYDDGRVAAP